MKLCTIHGCGNPRRFGGRYCKTCHARYMRGARAKVALTDEERELVEVCKIKDEFARGRKMAAICSNGGIRSLEDGYEVAIFKLTAIVVKLSKKAG